MIDHVFKLYNSAPFPIPTWIRDSDLTQVVCKKLSITNHYMIYTHKKHNKLLKNSREISLINFKTRKLIFSKGKARFHKLECDYFLGVKECTLLVIDGIKASRILQTYDLDSESLELDAPTVPEVPDVTAEQNQK